MRSQTHTATRTRAHPAGDPGYLTRATLSVVAVDQAAKAAADHLSHPTRCCSRCAMPPWACSC
jgi:hypothetical protein